jgi:DNA-binding Xre family transcriptional regulator
MSIQPEASKPPTLNEIAAAEVRAMMGRRNVRGVDLVPVLGLSQPQVAARVRGSLEWRLHELDVLAEFLGCEATDFLVRRQGLEPRTRWLSSRHLYAVS